MSNIGYSDMRFNGKEAKQPHSLKQYLNPLTFVVIIVHQLQKCWRRELQY